MECPNCGYFLNNNKVCPKCKIDIYIYNKTQNISIIFYNNGLKKAKSYNLSEAETLLEKSIIFNKFNIDARNLLGLVYFEKGKIGNSLKQWIISSSLKKTDNKATSYIEKLNKNTLLIDKMNDAIHLYNKSIIYINQGSIDIAIIRLKKAIELSPNFIDAYNLLCLCMIYIERFETALKYCEKVLKKDVHNKVALRYIKIIKENTKSNKSFIKKETETEHIDTNEISIRKKRKNNITYEQHKKKFSIIGTGEILSFIVGIICTASLILILVLPAMIDTRDKKISDLNSEVNILNLQLEAEIEKNSVTKPQINDNENKYIFESAIILYENKDFENCAVLLSNVYTELLSELDKEQYSKLVSDAYPKASNSFFDKGKIDFINNNYEKSEKYLKYCLKFSNNEDFVDDALYYLGKINESNSNLNEAKQNFEKIIHEFPDSNQYKNAENSLNNLLNEQSKAKEE